MTDAIDFASYVDGRSEGSRFVQTDFHDATLQQRPLVLDLQTRGVDIDGPTVRYDDLGKRKRPANRKAKGCAPGGDADAVGRRRHLEISGR